MKQPRNPSTPKTPSSLNPHPSSLNPHPSTVQSDLWNYLKPGQQEAIKPILRNLKKPAQEELCCSLLDYMETGIVLPPEDLLLAATFMYLTHQGISDVCGNDSKPIIRPLRMKDEGLGMRDRTTLNSQSSTLNQKNSLNPQL